MVPLSNTRGWRPQDIAPEMVVRVLDVALPHMDEARSSQLPRQKSKVNGPRAGLAGQFEAICKNMTRFSPGDDESSRNRIRKSSSGYLMLR